MTEMEMLKELRNVVAAAAGQAGGNRGKVKAEIRAQLVSTVKDVGLPFPESENKNRTTKNLRLSMGREIIGAELLVSGVRNFLRQISGYPYSLSAIITVKPASASEG